MIIAMTAISDDNPRFIKIMDSMSPEDKNILFEILSEKLPNKANEHDIHEHNSSSNERDLEEHNNLLLRIESLEKENH